MSLLERIQNRDCKVGIIGLGYVGLPLAVELAHGRLPRHRVRRRRVEGRRAERRAQLHPRRADRRAGRGGEVRALQRDHRHVARSPTWTASTSPCRRRCARRRTRTCPTSSRRSRRSRQHLRKGQLVSLESTTYPGTTDELVKPMLEETGLKAGDGLLPRVLARARRPGQPAVPDEGHPEGRRRHRQGEHRHRLRAVRRRSSRRPCRSARRVVAEMVKLLENTFRSVNIGLVNELALMCHRMDIDVWEVIDAAKTKPFGFMPFYPGPGPRRPLHPDRSVLPVVEGAAERVRGAVHRAGRPGEQLDARVGRDAGGRRAQHA